MDQFKQAVNLARGAVPLAPSADQSPLGDQNHRIDAGGSLQEARIKNVPLKAAHLESMRIVSHNKDDLRARSFDMLRTQVLQTMDNSGWQFLAVTSPTAGCGKTVTACNLALSIARLPERSVLLVDLDMRKPKVADYLGIKQDFGLLSVLQGRQNLSDAIVQVGIEREQLLVLPGEQTNASSEWMASPTVATLLQTIKREFRSRIVILDLPPILTGDDVLSILPQLQSVLLVAEAGSSSVSEVRACTKHLKATPVVRVVVNKITEREPTSPYHEYY
jgi:Mrp family chromosome partitioning ATPase